jgi:prepilin-type N-terminal cleavage/methylation domain-containing protein
MKKRGWWATLAGPGYAHNTERGMTLVEVLIALGIMTAVAVVFLAALSTSSKGVILNQKQIAAEGLAKSQMEYVKSQPYDSTHNPPVYGVDPSLTIPQGYNILPSAVRLLPQIVHPGNDEGLQKITVTITRGATTVFTLEGYKCRIGN